MFAIMVWVLWVLLILCLLWVLWMKLWIMLWSWNHLNDCDFGMNTMSTMGTLDTMVAMGITNDVMNNHMVIKSS